MKSILNRIRNSKGFVSIEVIMIAGIIIVIGSVVLFAFSQKANSISNTAVDQLGKANDSMISN